MRNCLRKLPPFSPKYWQKPAVSRQTPELLWCVKRKLFHHTYWCTCRNTMKRVQHLRVDVVLHDRVFVLGSQWWVIHGNRHRTEIHEKLAQPPGIQYISLRIPACVSYDRMTRWWGDKITGWYEDKTTRFYLVDDKILPGKMVGIWNKIWGFNMILRSRMINWYSSKMIRWYFVGW